MSSIKELEEEVENLSDIIEDVTILIHKLVSGLDQSDEVFETIDMKLREISNGIEAISNENEEKKQSLITQTISLMHQRRKAAQDVDDQYFENEELLKAHNKIENMISTSKEMIDKQKTLFKAWKEHIS